MKPSLVFAKAALGVWTLLLAGTPDVDDPAARHLRVERSIHVPPGRTGQACALLDADIYAHAGSASLNDVRLYANGSSRETPFTLTESNTERADTEPAAVRNLRADGSSIVFDLEMPRRPYTAVELTLNARDFTGSVKVSGRSDPEHAPGLTAGREVPLGEFAIFDLSGQHLSRSTTLPLQESSFPELHVQLHLQSAPNVPARAFAGTVVTGASVPPSRAAQTLYTPVAAASTWTQRGHASVATLRLPPHVPVARAEFTLDAGYRANFLRDVTISAKPDLGESADSAASDVETVTGEISQLHLSPAQIGPGAAGFPGVPVDNRQGSVEAVLAANLRGAASVDIAVANGNDTPLPLRSVQLEMRQHRLCFEAVPQASGYTLLYGDTQLPAPVYDYSRRFIPSATPVPATLGSEQPNPWFVPRADARPFNERHPDLLWIALLAALGTLAGVALRGVRQQRGASH